jgi:hypothetical protein
MMRSAFPIIRFQKSPQAETSAGAESAAVLVS